MKLFEPKTFFIIAIGVVVLTILALLIWLDVSNKYQQETIPVIEEKEKEDETPITGGKLEEVIPQLNTSQKLIDYLNENFVFKSREDNDTLALLDFFKNRRGDQQDFANFSSYVLDQNNFISFVFIYQYIEDEKENYNFLTIFRDTEDDLPKYIYFNQEGVFTVAYGWSFAEACQKEEERLGIEIVKYTSVLAPTTDTMPEEWSEIR